MLFKNFLFIPAAAVALLASMPAHAVINAGLQPYDLYQNRYDRVLVLQVASVDAASATVKCKTIKTLKGNAEAQEDLSLVFSGPLAGVLEQALKDGDFQVGDPIAVFAGRKRATKDLMIYANSFYLGKIKEPGVWEIDRTGQGDVGVDGEQINTLAGTWNGSTPRFVELLEDIAAGRDHFPRKAYVRFMEDKALAKLDGPVQALAAFDLNGDGMDDIIACSEKGDRVFLQTDPMVFQDATDTMGLKSASSSVAVADVNHDGLNDVLLGGVLYHGVFSDNRFHLEKTDCLPAGFLDKLKTATFAEINGDGYPDVVASVTGGGLRVFLNPGKDGGAFLDVTEKAGLAQESSGSKEDGYVTIGDWNDDGRADLFLAAGKGYWLVQQKDGTFQAQDHSIEFKFTTGLDDQQGLTGAGVFMPVVSHDRVDMIVPMEESWLVIENQNGMPKDVTRWGNEISEGSNDHLLTIGEDLNLDGHMDLFTVSSSENGHNRYIINRGYGSFMLAPVHKHYEHVFKGPSSERGGLSAAAADLNDDGAPDLIVGNAHGEITILLNDTLEVRKPIEHPQREVAVLEGTHLLQVRPIDTKGLVGARLLLKSADGRVIGRRDLGSNSSGGSWGPNRITFAVRQPGPLTLEVRYADGLVKTHEVDLTKDRQVALDLSRGDQSNTGDW